MPYHKNTNAPDAISLMRSRFCAFSISNIQYIIKTSTHQNDYNDLEEFSKNCKFKKLDILEYDTNYVIFKAHIFCDGVDNTFVEKSFFIKKEGKWLYDRGDIIHQ
jgi:SEC-C motif-containing protein